jgi:hypothetical protein
LPQVLLTALELPELITASLEEYTRQALILAHSPGILAELRAKLTTSLRPAERSIPTSIESI